MTTAFDFATDDVFACSDLGEAATYTPVSGATSSMTVIIDRNVFAIGDMGQVVERRTMIRFRRSEKSAVKVGDRITVGAESWTLQGVESDDGYVIHAHARIA